MSQYRNDEGDLVNVIFLFAPRGPKKDCMPGAMAVMKKDEAIARTSDMTLYQHIIVRLADGATLR